jgi:hypothetical protein
MTTFFHFFFVIHLRLNFQNYTKLSNSGKFVYCFIFAQFVFYISLSCCNWSPNYSVLVVFVGLNATTRSQLAVGCLCAVCNGVGLFWTH